MARRHRVAKRRVLTQRERWTLIAGQGRFARTFGSLVAAQAAWAMHRDELIAATSEQRPGSRPAAYWLFESPRSCWPPPPTRRLGGALDDVYEPGLTRAATDRLFGDRLAAAQIHFLTTNGLLGDVERLLHHNEGTLR